MPSQSDPTFHQSAERQMIEHVMRLLGEPKFVLDTTSGRRAITALERNVARSDRGVDVKRSMSELNVPDRALQERMPAGEMLDVALKQRLFFIFRKTVGHLRVINQSPTRELITGKDPSPMDVRDVETILRQSPPPMANVPLTLVLVSTAGFTPEAKRLGERSASRTVILAEPNSSGGWTVFGPPEIKALIDLINPEADEERRARIHREIDSAKVDLLTSGISTEKLATKLKLPLQLVETEVKSYAKQNPGLAAKRIDGRVVLFREGSTPIASGASHSPGLVSNLAGGFGMPLIDRIRTLFSRKGETEKKIAFLSERRAALSQQREAAYEEITALEGKDDSLRAEFKAAGAPLTKRRITSQLVQLRKDIERRQQMITVLNQQVNVVSTHLHNLELAQQGESAQLPDSEEIATDAAAAEEMIAQLQADTELADSVAGVAATSGMTDEEQALYEELENETGGPSDTSVRTASNETAPRDVNASRAPEQPAKPQAEPKRRAEPEAS